MKGRVVTAVDAVRALALGGEFSCALHGSGVVTCWGELDALLALEPADEQAAHRAVPAQARRLDRASDYVALAAGWEHVCAVRASGRVRCWGRNGSGQVDGIGGGQRKGDEVAGVTDAVAVAVGSEHSCALTKMGTVWCWGLVGAGSQTSAARNDYAPRELVALRGATSIAAGTEVTCGAVGNQVKCSGHPSEFMFEKDSPEYPFKPKPAIGVTDAVDVAVTRHRACALRKTGGVVCWGAGGLSPIVRDNQLVHVPMPVPGIDDALSLGANEKFFWAVRASGKTVTWGSQWGYSGMETIDFAPGQFVHGREFWCGIEADGGVKCRYFGNATKPLDKIRLPAKAERIAAGESAVCVVDDQGDVHCWGNLCGEGASQPRKIAGMEKVKEISVSEQGSGCGVRRDGSVACWSVCEPMSIRETSLGPAMAISDRCVARTDGTVACEEHDRRVTQRSISGAVRLSMRRELLCAVAEGEKVICSGDGAAGQLGTGVLSTGPFTIHGIGAEEDSYSQRGEAPAPRGVPSGAKRR